MNFKMSAKDFELLAKYVNKKAKGSDLSFKSDNSNQMEVRLTLENGEDARVIFFTEEMSSFPKVVTSRNLGEEV